MSNYNLKTQTSGLKTSRPPRCSLVNISTGESIDCLFNPENLVETVSVNWNRLNVPGLSHQVLQYQSSGNRKITSLDFYLDRFFASRQPGSPDILTFRSFLRALTVPMQGEMAPPRTLFVWPKVLSIETVLTELEFQYQQFASDASVLVYTARCELESILDVRVTAEDLRKER